jgi:hypothetical protein
VFYLMYQLEASSAGGDFIDFEGDGSSSKGSSCISY